MYKNYKYYIVNMLGIWYIVYIIYQLPVVLSGNFINVMPPALKQKYTFSKI